MNRVVQVHLKNIQPIQPQAADSIGLEHLCAQARVGERRFGAVVVADRRDSRAQAILRPARRRGDFRALAARSILSVAQPHPADPSGANAKRVDACRLTLGPHFGRVQVPKRERIRPALHIKIPPLCFGQLHVLSLRNGGTDMAVTEKDLEEFGRFATEQLKNGGAESLQELVTEWDKLKRWNERNAISDEQSCKGLSKPLDLEGVLERVGRRIADQGNSE